MAQFASEIVQVNSSVGTTPAMIWNPSNNNTTSLGLLGSVPAATIFSGLIVANTGTNTIYITSGSLTGAGGGTIPLAVPPASEVYLSGYSGTVGTAGTVWANTSTGSSSTQCGLPSVASVI